jgi:antitoxin (DNA-binding transcriptional repressor) of toxin-antitoxin stability system
MIKLNIHGAKTHLSRYLEKVQKGGEILLCERNYPVTEIKAMPSRQISCLPKGLAKIEFQIPDASFDKLLDETVVLFYGENS